MVVKERPLTFTICKMPDLLLTVKFLLYYNVYHLLYIKFCDDLPTVMYLVHLLSFKAK